MLTFMARVKDFWNIHLNIWDENRGNIISYPFTSSNYHLRTRMMLQLSAFCGCSHVTLWIRVELVHFLFWFYVKKVLFNANHAAHKEMLYACGSKSILATLFGFPLFAFAASDCWLDGRERRGTSGFCCKANLIGKMGHNMMTKSQELAFQMFNVFLSP